MTAYILVIVFINNQGMSAINIDYPSKTLCEMEGNRVIRDLPDSKYFCLERK